MIERLLPTEPSSLQPLAPGAAPPRCDRLWPAAAPGSWLARASTNGATYWGLLAPAGKWPKALQRLYDRDRCRWLPELEALAWRMADDPVLSGLDPLPPKTPSSRRNGQQTPPAQGRVVGYKPLRRVVTRFDDSQGSAIAFAKRLRLGDGQRVAQHHRLIADWSRERGSFRVPDLMTPTDPENLVYAPAPGRPLKMILEGDDAAAAARAVTRTGRAIAGVHQCPRELHQVHDRRAELETLDRWLAIGERALGNDDRLRASYAALRAVSRALPEAPLALAHRDLHDGQLLIAEDRVTILDLDTLSRAEPELDLGNLLAHFDLFALSAGRAPGQRLTAALLDGYRRAGGRPVDGDRLLWYRAAATVRLACVHAGRGDSRAQTGALLLSAQRLIGILAAAPTTAHREML